MVIGKKLLILEDDLKTLSSILKRLSVLEEDKEYDFCTIVMSDYTQVQDYINNNPKADFDVILLDRDCKLGGSFHILDIEKFGVDKIISISSTPTWNEEARAREVKRIVPKRFSDLDGFAREVIIEIKDLLVSKK